MIRIPVTFFVYEDEEMKDREEMSFLLEFVHLPIDKQSLSLDLIDNIEYAELFEKYKDYDMVTFDFGEFFENEEGGNLVLIYLKGYYSWNDDSKLCFNDDIHYDYRKKNSFLSKEKRVAISDYSEKELN